MNLQVKKILPKINIVTFSKAQFSAFIGGVVDYGSMIFITEFIHIHYTISIIISGIIGAYVNFNINKKWSFATKDGCYAHNQIPQLIKFCIVVLNSIFLKTSGTFLLTNYLRLDYKISRIVIDLIVSLLFNYNLQKKWVFKKTI